MCDATLEATPISAAKVDDFRHHIAEGTTIYVTFLPGTAFHDTLALVRRLKSEGMHPVTHLAARSITPMLGALVDAQASREVLVIGSGVDEPVGEFEVSMQLLDTGLFQQHGVQKIGIAGHPEGSPDISDAAIQEALLEKMAYGKEHGLELYITTQFCFEIPPIIAWHDMLRGWGNDLPIHISLSGPATVKILLRFAQILGIGNSMRFIKNQAKNVIKLLMQQTPDELIVGLSAYTAAHPDSAIRRCHLYPFAGFAKTAAWFDPVQLRPHRTEQKSQQLQFEELNCLSCL
ncbi:MAG: metFprotein [Alphaproteobacteria bacterium]|nr:metFprotein [Alphaproteobacteria bacterium]